MFLRCYGRGGVIPHVVSCLNNWLDHWNMVQWPDPYLFAPNIKHRSNQLWSQLI